MPESTGAKLKQARLAKGLSLPDVAKATRMPVQRIAALEADDFSSFPSEAYGRGFLVIYGKHLGVDVSEQAQLLEGHSAIHKQDYEYLNRATVAPLPEDSIAPKERTPSIVPLLVFVGIVGFLGAIVYLISLMKRI